MNKYLLLMGLSLALSGLAFAQSATILPHSSAFISNSAEESAFALKAVMNNPIPGKFSTTIRADNYSTTTDGIALWATHFGAGTAIRASSDKGLGLLVSSIEGTGLFAESQAQSAAQFSTSTSTTTSEVVGIQAKNLGTGLNISLKNTANANPGLAAYTVGTGPGALIKNLNANGIGAGMVVGKEKAYPDPYTTEAIADFEVRHTIEKSIGTTGLRLFNTGPNAASWTFYTVNYSGDMLLYAKSAVRGTFNGATGAYTVVSDKRMKTNISEYPASLANVMKMEVKSYRRTNSDKTEIGLMAQDALKIFPEIVYDNTNDKGEQFYTMDYSRIGVIAIKAIQEQQSLIARQQQTIDEQQKQLQKHQAAIELLIQKVEALEKK
ncbi:tail fiber domain-containing protein [Emticicia agri]|uniref:Peptidase S74 domain-containing protein n=1 Tax=Emticicia agri TaxID=2492393 RepID=A0A4Q5LTN1_9BACT|nr:tail fiber domain-containing protein [Emticicia agri]RYU92981.1 hypothetical protein EWM59_24395 [Emticicia agri]